MAPTSNPSLPARAKGRDRPFAEAIAAVQGALREPPMSSLIEGEIEGIRQEIQSLVENGFIRGRGSHRPSGDRAEGTITAMLTLMLGGFFIVGVTSLIMGYIGQRRAIDRERRRQRALTLSIRRMRDQLRRWGAPSCPRASRLR